MKVKQWGLIVFYTTIVGFNLFSSNAIAESKEKIKPEFVVKIATLAPQGTAWMKPMRAVANYIEEQTEGRVHTKFYAGGVLGDEPDVVRKMKLGQVDGAAVSLSGVRLTCPEFQVMELPFLFGYPGYEEAEYVYDRLTNEFDKYAEKRGYKVFAISTAGFAYICSKEPLQNIITDLPRQKFWQWEGENVMKAISDSLNIPTISLPLPDTLTALQTGMVNAFYGTPLHVLNFQWYKYINYMYSPPIFYTPSFAIATMKTWNSLPPDIQEYWFDETVNKIKEESLGQIHEADQKALEVLKGSGIQVVDIPPDQLKEIQDRTFKLWKEMAGDIYPQELLDKIVSILEEYRSQQKEVSLISDR